MYSTTNLGATQATVTTGGTLDIEKFRKQMQEIQKEYDNKPNQGLNRSCPSCGYCPHCGRGGHQTYPYYYPSYPWITYTSGGAADPSQFYK